MYHALCLEALKYININGNILRIENSFISLASFSCMKKNSARISQASKSDGSTFPSTFQFGMATAPAHEEDNLEDAWLDFAKKRKIAAFTNAPNPDQRLMFWSNPEIELKASTSRTSKLSGKQLQEGRAAFDTHCVECHAGKTGESAQWVPLEKNKCDSLMVKIHSLIEYRIACFLSSNHVLFYDD